MKAKSMKAKRMVSVMLAVLLIFSLAIPCVANGTEVNEPVYACDFEGEEDIIFHGDIWKWKASAFRNGPDAASYASQWVNEADNDAFGEFSISETEGRNGGHALKMRGNHFSQHVVYKTLKGFEAEEIYELTAWIKFVPGDGAKQTTDLKYSATLFIGDNVDRSSSYHHTTGSGAAAGGGFQTLNYGKNWFDTYDGTKGTDGAWVQYKRYFSHTGPTTKNAQLCIGTKNSDDEKAYTLIDDIQIRKVGNLVVSDASGAEVSNVSAGNTYTGKVLLANATEEVKSYVGVQAIYEMVEGKKRLVATEVFDAGISVPRTSVNTDWTKDTRCGYYSKDVTLDLTDGAYSNDKAYSAKIFVWDSFTGLKPAFTGEI